MRYSPASPPHPRPASYLCNSQNKGQESIKQTHAWLGTQARAIQNITQSIMSREEQMNGITDVGRIPSFSIRKRTAKSPATADFSEDAPHYSGREIPLICCLNRNHKCISEVAALSQAPAGNSGEKRRVFLMFDQ